MRKIIYALHVSLDGFIEGPDGALDWCEPSPELHQYFNNLERETSVHLYGRRLYETMDYWRTADINSASSAVETEFAELWRQVPTIVFSTTLEQVEGNARLVKDNIAEEIARLKAQPGKNMNVGGADMAATLMKLGLIDEYQLCICPVVLGGGKPFFTALDAKINLRLVETKTFAGGVVLLRYQREEKSSES